MTAKKTIWGFTTKQWGTVALLVWVWIVPVSAFASTSHTFTCAELTHDINGGGTCTGSTMTVAGTGERWRDTIAIYPMTSGQTYYVSFSGNATGKIRVNGQSNYELTVSGVFNYTEYPFVSNVSGEYAHRFFSNPGIQTFGTVSTVCITDTIGGCGGTPAGMYSASAAVADWYIGAFGLGQIVSLVIFSILSVLVALLGLGYGIRYLMKYITGRKSWSGKMSSGDNVADTLEGVRQNKLM